MATKMPPYKLLDFSLGLNNKDGPNLIADQALVDVQNALIGKGFISKRYGFVKYTPAALANPITKLYEFFKNDGTTEFLAVSNTTLYKDNAGTLAAIPFNTIPSLTTSDVQMLTYKDRTIKDVVLLADGGKLKVYNGTNVSDVTPHVPTTGTTGEEAQVGLNDLAKLTKFRALAIKKDRIFVAAHPSVKNRVNFCHHDPTLGYAVYDYFPAPYFFDVAADENDEILELKVFRDALIIMCKRSMWVLLGDGTALADYQLHKINVPSGCISAKSVTMVGNNMFYLSDDHVYSLFSTDQNYVSAEIVSYNVEATLNSISRADKEKAVGTFFDNKYYLSFPDGTCLVYDTLLAAWSKWTNIKANSFLNRNGVLYFSTATGLIYKFDEAVFNDDGAAISFLMKTKNLDFGFPVQVKKFKKLWTVAKQYDVQTSTLSMTAVVDYVPTVIDDISTDQSLVWGEGNWGETTWGFVDVVEDKQQIRQQGKHIQLVITDDKPDQPVTIYGFVFLYKLKKPK